MWCAKLTSQKPVIDLQANPSNNTGTSVIDSKGKPLMPPLLVLFASHWSTRTEVFASVHVSWNLRKYLSGNACIHICWKASLYTHDENGMSIYTWSKLHESLTLGISMQSTFADSTGQRCIRWKPTLYKRQWGAKWSPNKRQSCPLITHCPLKMKNSSSQHKRSKKTIAHCWLLRTFSLRNTQKAHKHAQTMPSKWDHWVKNKTG